MTWGRMDDKFHRNRKVRALRQMEGGRLALGTWVFWWSWCLDDPELSGVVPASELSATDEQAAQLLIEVGLWERVDGGFAFHDFHAYNPSRSQIEAKRQADRERVAAKRNATRANVVSDSDATNPRVASRARVPSRPIPNSPLPPKGAGASRCAEKSPEGETTIHLVAEAVRSEAQARHLAPVPLVPTRDLRRAAERVDAAVADGAAPDRATAATELVHAAFALGDGPKQRPLRFALLEATIASSNGQSAQARHVPPEDPWV